MRRERRWAPAVAMSAGVLTHDPVTVRVRHEVTGGMAAPDRCNAVCMSFGTQYPTVAVVVPRGHLSEGSDRGAAHSWTSVRAKQGA